MSEIRSWDGHGIKYRSSKKDSICFVNSPKDEHSFPVRVVAWPEGAPRQEDVPQAGEKVEISNQRFIVLTGIPYKSNTRWYLKLIKKGEKTSYGHEIRFIQRIPPAQPRSYTEDEILEAISKTKLVLPNFYTEDIIKHLKNKP